MTQNEADIRLVAAALAPEYPGAPDDDGYRADAVRVLEALAGRVIPEPARTEWGVRWGSSPEGFPRPEASARTAAVRWPNATLVRRTVGPWVTVETQVTPPGPPTFFDRRAAVDPSVDHSSHSTGWVGRCGECPDDGPPVPVGRGGFLLDGVVAVANLPVPGGPAPGAPTTEVTT